MSWWKSKEEKAKIKLEKDINKLKKPGKVYTKAQLLALKRKAQGKTIAQVKAENEAAMRKRAKAKHAAYKEKLKINKKKKKNKKVNYGSDAAGLTDFDKRFNNKFLNLK